MQSTARVDTSHIYIKLVIHEINLLLHQKISFGFILKNINKLLYTHGLSFLGPRHM